jgi:hypothetical protein
MSVVFDIALYVSPFVAGEIHFIHGKWGNSTKAPRRKKKPYDSISYSSINKKKTIYNSAPFDYDRQEQSRRSRVKCRRNGELSDGRRIVFHDGITAPAVAYRITSFM